MYNKRKVGSKEKKRTAFALLCMKSLTTNCHHPINKGLPPNFIYPSNMDTICCLVKKKVLRLKEKNVYY